MWRRIKKGDEISAGCRTYRVKPHFVAESLITSTVTDALSRIPRETFPATRVRVRPRDQPEPDVTTEEERRLIASLRQMNTNLGHSSNHALARAIRVTGGSAAAVRAALQLRCDVCESQQHLGPHLPARLRTDREIGDTAATDLFVLADYEVNQLSFMNILDLASTFGVVAMIPSKHPKIVKSTSPDTENHDKNGYAKLNDDNNIFMTNVDKSDTTYTDKHNNTKYNVRNM